MAKPTVDYILGNVLLHSHQLTYDLKDVVIVAPADNEALMYDSLSGKWKNQGIPAGITSHAALSDLDYASAAHTGFEPTLTKGNLTESTSSVLTIGSGTGAVIGTGTTIEVDQADTTNDGYLSATDWNTFNNKLSTATADTTFLKLDGSNDPVTGNIDFTDAGLGNVKSIQMDTTIVPLANAEGLMQWNSTDGTLDLGMQSGTITQQIGQELFIKVINKTGVLIDNGSAVYFDGRQGNRPKIALAKGDAHATSMVMGLTTEDIADNTEGYITTFGYVRQIKTDYATWTEGQNLYVSTTTAGALTNVEPAKPNHSDIVGTIGVVGGAGIGSIFVSIDRHMPIEELSNVDGVVPTTGDILEFQGTNVWEASGTLTSHIANTSNPHSTSDANLIVTDIATNNASTLAHGFLQKLPGSASQFLNGAGNFITIPASASAPPGFSETTFSGQTSVNVVHNFGFKPLVQVMDTSGSPLVFIPLTIAHNSDNDFTVTFSTSTSGTIIASVGSPPMPNVTSTSINYTVLTNDNIVIANAFNITLTLPTAVGKTGKTYTLDNNSTGDIFVTGTGGELIQGLLTQTIPTQSSAVVYSTNAGWRFT